MTKGAPLRWVENRILRRYLRGRGLEIGALWRRFPVRAGVRVWYVDRLNPEGLDDHYGGRLEKIISPDVVADAAHLPVAAGGVDFIIASHVLEHLPFPLAGLRGWHDALAPGGVLLLRVPDMRYTMDRRRPRTPLQHLVAEQENPQAFDRRAHFAEWVEHVQGRAPTDRAFETILGRLLERDYSIHYHAWVDDDVREMIEYTRSAWGLRWEPQVFWRAHFYRKEAVALVKKT